MLEHGVKEIRSRKRTAVGCEKTAEGMGVRSSAAWRQSEGTGVRNSAARNAPGGSVDCLGSQSATVVWHARDRVTITDSFLVHRPCLCRGVPGMGGISNREVLLT